MNSPELLANLDAQALAILEAGEPWTPGALVAAEDVTLTGAEKSLIDDRVRYWEKRITQRNGMR